MKLNFLLPVENPNSKRINFFAAEALEKKTKKKTKKSTWLYILIFIAFVVLIVYLRITIAEESNELVDDPSDYERDLDQVAATGGYDEYVKPAATEESF